MERAVFAPPPDSPLDEADPAARVPTRVVVLSILGVWLCYFTLATLRGAVVGFDPSWEFVSRRLVVTAASIVVTAALWPLIEALDARPLPLKAAVVAIGALPASLLLAAINQWAFADIDARIMMKSGANAGIRIRRDEAGNVLVDLPPPPPAPPAPPGTGSSAQSATVLAADAGHGPWAELTDIATGRYFLLLAWAALYLALANGRQLRAAERREGEFRRAAEAAELRSLRYQVNPHFLFNTLNSLSALVMTERHEDAEAMIQTLSTFYRRTLSGDPTEDIALADEIELQQLYLDIEAVRFPRRLLRVIELPQALARVLVPGMILQPLVENSVKYAVAATSAPVTITIAARADAEALVLSVSDDGGGASAAAAGEPRAPSRGCGIGLQNVRDRLDARFGSAATLAAAPLAEGGHRTTLRMPLVRAHG